MFKYFWNTILFFIVVSFVLLVAVFIKQNNQENTTNSKNPSKTAITSNIVEIFSDEIKQNLKNKAPLILENFEATKDNINYIINSNLDGFFNTIIDENLDSYLDFHYSVKGEYIQLFSMALGDINKLINEKLLGNNFNNKLNLVSNNIIEESYKSIENHLNFTKNLATTEVDLKLNQNSLSNLSEKIENNLKQNLVNTKATLITSAVATKLAISIATKVSAKVAAKTTAKMSAKLATSSTAATSGVLCGPAVAICGTIAGIVTWFGTDAVVISADEYLNKDEFRKEIIDSLNEAKEELKVQFSPILEQFNKISLDFQNDLENTKIKKRVIDNLK